MLTGASVGARGLRACDWAGGRTHAQDLTAWCGFVSRQLRNRQLASSRASLQPRKAEVNVSQFPNHGLCLDIGPKNIPRFPKHKNARYLDVQSRENLIRRYGFDEHKAVAVPTIDYIWNGSVGSRILNLLVRLAFNTCTRRLARPRACGRPGELLSSWVF